MAVEFNPSGTKVRKSGKCVAVFEQADGGTIVWFQAIKGTHFSEDFTSEDLRAIADKLDELNSIEQDSENPVYSCLSCGHEDDPDKFGKLCPSCGTDLDELEREAER